MLDLVQDEPAEQDKVQEVGGLKFLIDGDLANHLQRYLPLNVDYDERFWSGIRVRPARQTGCC